MKRDLDKDKKQTKTRMAKCSYCNQKTISDKTLPFFSERPHDVVDRYYCGCRGWD